MTSIRKYPAAKNASEAIQTVFLNVRDDSGNARIIYPSRGPGQADGSGIDDTAPMFSQGLFGPSFGPKPTLDQVNRLVAKFQDVSKNVIPITVVRNPSQIIGVEFDVPAGVKPLGALINGQIYLFTDNLRSTGDVSVTIFHELFHLGLCKVIPAEDYAALLSEFAKGPLAQSYITAADANDAEQEAIAAAEAAMRDIPETESQSKMSFENAMRYAGFTEQEIQDGIAVPR